jgi:hypothetical protein
MSVAGLPAFVGHGLEAAAVRLQPNFGTSERLPALDRNIDVLAQQLWDV